MIRRRALLLCLAGACTQIAPARAAESAAPAAPIVPIPTVIESLGSGEMVSTATESIFTLRDHVSVTATNMKLTCDELVVVAKRTGDPKATFGKQENFKSLLATGHVRIIQSDREALCDKAEVLPGEDKVTLDGNVTVRSLSGAYVETGPKATLFRNERRAVFDQPRFVLPSLKDLGPGKNKDKEPAETPGGPATPTPDAAPVINVPLAPTAPPPK